MFRQSGGKFHAKHPKNCRRCGTREQVLINEGTPLKQQYFIADGFAFIFSAPKEKYDQRQTPNFVTIAFSSEQGSSV